MVKLAGCNKTLPMLRDNRLTLFTLETFQSTPMTSICTSFSEIRISTYVAPRSCSIKTQSSPKASDTSTFTTEKTLRGASESSTMPISETNRSSWTGRRARLTLIPRPTSLWEIYQRMSTSKHYSESLLNSEKLYLANSKYSSQERAEDSVTFSSKMRTRQTMLSRKRMVLRSREKK